MNLSNDTSISAWKDDNVKRYRDDYQDISAPQGLLAATPNVFGSTERKDALTQFYIETPNWPISTSTNKGLQVTFLMCENLGFSSGLVYIAILNCPIGHSPGVLPAIRLRRFSPNSDQYARIDLFQLYHIAVVDSDGYYLYEGFDPIQPQHQLSDMNTSKLPSLARLQVCTR
jgi:hypothetical protein